ncbi:MAG: DMT family transporter [Pseudomonadota bacterium]
MSLTRYAPATFVLLWSTGFLGAKLGLPYADWASFLFLRFAAASILLCAICVFLAARLPAIRDAGPAAVAGLLIHFGYLGGVFAAIEAGLPAGLTALIVGLQPALTAVIAWPVFGERLSVAAMCGCVLGVAGVGLVVADGAGWSPAALSGADPFAYVAAIAALAAMTAGFLHQKRIGDSIDPWAAQTIQAVAAAAAFGLAALIVGELRVVWTGEFVFALAWLVLVLTLGAIGLLYALMKIGAAAKTASLFFLTPATTAVLAWLLFNEQLGWGGVAGFACAGLGVWLVRRRG